MQAPKTALVTGASTGMGRATVRLLARKGWRVYGATRHPERLDEEGVTPLALDLRDPCDVAEKVAALPPLDLLVNNAGYGLVSTVEEADEAMMRMQFEINLFGLLRVTKAAVPAMRRRRQGVIVNISSFLGKIGLPLLTFYNASKYAVEGVTDSLRHELAPFGIRVHAVMPGFFDTQFARENLVVNPATLSPDSPYRDLAQHLAPRLVDQINHGNEPMEVAELVLRIAEDPESPARVAAGERAKQLLPMRRSLDDETFERRVRDYFGF
jgi:NAD(P)-dependent dehydrogenase (short-subunit alcohol dehydrogenase family)